MSESTPHTGRSATLPGAPARRWMPTLAAGLSLVEYLRSLVPRVAVLVAILLVGIWALAGRGYFWPAWVMVLAAIPIVIQGWKAYGPANRISEDDVQREIARAS